MKPLNTVSRILISSSALLMVTALYIPLWQILMWAPQYPEGLEMKIWLDTITGDYKIISGLNHYIGMKHIEVSMFPEFTYMRYIVIAMVIFGLVTAVVNKRSLLVGYVIMIFAAAVAGLADFYLWGYDYGHNLDPKAAIVVPGMAYQPPLIGTKQLLNFTAYSAPDIGGYVFLLSGLSAIGALIYELRFRTRLIEGAAIGLMLFLCSCAVEPAPLQFGKDACHFCKMTLVDDKFGAEVVTTKGKIYKFDDLNCMKSFLTKGEVPASNIHFMLVADFANPPTLIHMDEAILVQSDQIKSPMGSEIAAFKDKLRAEEYNRKWKGQYKIWSDVAP